MLSSFLGHKNSPNNHVQNFVMVIIKL